MNYNHLISQIESKIAETTTMDAITYLPSQVGAVKAKIDALAKKKKEWKIEILETEDGYEVQFEDALKVHVPRSFWEEFRNLAGITERVSLNESKLFEDEKEDQTKHLLKRIEKLIGVFFTRRPFLACSEIYSIWKNRFRGTDQIHQDAVVNITKVARDQKKLLSTIKKEYGDDVGYLEMLIEAMSQNRGLSAFAGFMGYTYLYGGKSSTRFGVLEVGVTQSLQLTIKISIKDEELLQEIKNRFPSITVDKNTIYPSPTVSDFRRICEKIHKILGE